MNNHLNVLRKQAKFDLKCSKMLPKPPNHEGKPLPSYIPGYATGWSSHFEHQ